MNLRRLLTIATALIAAGMATAASAAPMIITASGTITNGYDGDNLFGLASGNFVGQSYQLTVAFELDELTVESGHYTFPGFFEADNFAYVGASLSSYASLTINGASHTMFGEHGINLRRYAVTNNDGSTSFAFDFEFYPSDGVIVQMGMSSPTAFFGNLDPNSPLDFVPYDTIYGGGQISPNTNLNFDVQNFTVTPASTEVAAVPEPATWGMMLLGFGMIGAALRSRRTQVRFG